MYMCPWECPLNSVQGDGDIRVFVSVSMCTCPLYSVAFRKGPSVTHEQSQEAWLKELPGRSWMKKHHQRSEWAGAVKERYEGEAGDIRWGSGRGEPVAGLAAVLNFRGSGRFWNRLGRRHSDLRNGKSWSVNPIVWNDRSGLWSRCPYSDNLWLRLRRCGQRFLPTGLHCAVGLGS